MLDREELRSFFNRALQRAADELLEDSTLMRPYDETYGPEDAEAMKRTAHEVRGLPVVGDEVT
jgi:hypothetical protein